MKNDQSIGKGQVPQNISGREQEGEVSLTEKKLKCPACGYDNELSAEICVKCRQRFKPLAVPPSTNRFGQIESSISSVGKQGLEFTPDSGREGEMLHRLESSDEEGLQKSAFNTYAQTQEIRYYFGTTPPKVYELVPASLFVRASAFFIDFIIILFLSIFLASLLGFDAIFTELQVKQAEIGIFNLSKINEVSPELIAPIMRFSYFMFALAVGYFGIFGGIGGQSVGKALVGIKVLRVNGKELGLFLGVGRALVLWSLINISMGLYLFLSILVSTFERSGRAPHDYLFGTSVYRISTFEE